MITKCNICGKNMVYMGMAFTGDSSSPHMYSCRHCGHSQSGLPPDDSDAREPVYEKTSDIKFVIQEPIVKCSELGDVTLKEYLKALLSTLIKEEECFSAKHPFGNSGWKWDIYKALIENNPELGELDEDGYIDKVDTEKADGYILKEIENIFR